MKTAKEILDRYGISCIGGVDYDDAIDAMKEYAKQIKEEAAIITEPTPDTPHKVTYFLNNAAHNIRKMELP